MPIDSESLYLRIRRITLFKRESSYLNAHNRDQFLKVMKVPAGQFLNHVKEDCYLSELIKIFSVGEQLQEPEDELLIKAENCRKRWWSQEREGILFSQPYIPVDELVHKTQARAIVKFIAQFKIAVFFLSLFLHLEKARKRGGLREREEMKILSVAKTTGSLAVVKSSSEIGFKWVGIAAQLRIETLYHRLRKGGYIERTTSLKQFNDIFSGEPVAEPVIWLKTNTLLLYFTDQIIRHELVKSPDEVEDYLLRKRNEEPAKKADGYKHTASSWQYARIIACFISKTHKPFVADKLKHQRNDLDNKNGEPVGGEMIKQMIKDIAAIREIQ